jgi:ABC-2 type transport system ATP-binding protein
VNAVVEARGLGKRYGRRWALTDCTLAIPPGRVVGLVGPNGAGKTTLTLAVAKRPELLLLDEPVASLDPLARREFLQGLMETVAEHGVSVVLSSQLIADVERVCDYLVVLTASRVRVAGETEALLASHHRLSGPRRDTRAYPTSWEVIEESHTDKQSVLLVRTDQEILDPTWTVRPVSLEDLVLAYMSQPNDAARAGRPRLEVAS